VVSGNGGRCVFVGVYLCDCRAFASVHVWTYVCVRLCLEMEVCVCFSLSVYV